MGQQGPQNYTCEMFEEDLSGFLEGHVTSELREGIHVHFSECSDCRELKEAVAKSVIECRTLSRSMEPSAELEERLIRVMVPDWELKCSTFETKLGEFIDGTLDSSLNRQLARHGKSCGDCENLLRMVRQGIAETNAIADGNRGVSPNLSARLSAIPNNERGGGFGSNLRLQLRGMFELFGNLTASPILSQATAAVLLIVMAGFFLGVTTEAQERDTTSITHGVDMLVKTYRDGSDAVLNAVGYGKDEPVGGTNR